MLQKRVLLVEEISTVRKIISYYPIGLGINVIEANDVIEAGESTYLIRVFSPPISPSPHLSTPPSPYHQRVLGVPDQG